MLRPLLNAGLEKELKRKIAAFSPLDFGGEEVTADLAAASEKNYPKPPVDPTRGRHPRVLFTAADLPGIRAALTDPRNAVAVELFREAVAHPTDGDFGIAEQRGDKFYNFNQDVLIDLQALALNYASNGDRLSGLRAIYALKNALKTMDFRDIGGDQCRQFGFVAFTAACVYDLTVSCFTSLYNHHFSCLIITISIISSIVFLVLAHGVWTHHIEVKLKLSATLSLEEVSNASFEVAYAVPLFVHDLLVLGKVIGGLELHVLELRQDDQSFLLTKIVGTLAHGNLSGTLQPFDIGSCFTAHHGTSLYRLFTDRDKDVTLQFIALSILCQPKVSTLVTDQLCADLGSIFKCQSLPNTTLGRNGLHHHRHHQQ